MEQNLLDNAHFVYYLFNLTAASLFGLSVLTNQSYQLLNIVIWFGLIPAVWLALIANRSTRWLNLVSVGIFIYMFVIAKWAEWFDGSVAWLNEVGASTNTDYRTISVYICVFVPAIITAYLIVQCTEGKIRRRLIYSFTTLMILVLLFFPISNYLIKNQEGLLNNLIGLVVPHVT